MNEYKNRKFIKSSKYNIIKIINDIGFENFKQEILIECNKDELDYYEMFFIDKYNSYNPHIGYNSSHINTDNKKCLNDETKGKMSKSHINLSESVETKRKKSNKIYAIKNDEIYVCDSAKLFGDFIGKSKDIIKNGLRKPNKVKGFRLYYDDYNKRNDIINKRKKLQYIKDKEYDKIANYLNRSSVETREHDYKIFYLKYSLNEKGYIISRRRD